MAAAAALSDVERAEYEQAAALAAVKFKALVLGKAVAGEPEAIEGSPDSVQSEGVPPDSVLLLYAAKLRAETPDMRRRLLGNALYPLVAQVESMRWGPCTRCIQLRPIA